MDEARHVPQVDLTTINAVYSLFTPGPPDLWSPVLASDFVDFILWNDTVSIPAAVPSDSIVDEEKMVPSVLTDLMRRDPGWLSLDLRVQPEPRQLLPTLLDPALREFSAFATNNASHVRRFLEVHNTPWMDIQKRSRAGRSGHYVFDVAELASRPGTHSIAAKLQIPDDQIHYLLDLVLKYLIYAEHANDSYYLTHPIRAKQRFNYLDPTIESYHDRPLKRIPFRLGPYLVLNDHSYKDLVRICASQRIATAMVAVDVAVATGGGGAKARLRACVAPVFRFSGYSMNLYGRTL